MKYIVQERTHNPATYLEFEDYSDRSAHLFIKLTVKSQEKYRHLEIQAIDVDYGKNETTYTLGDKEKIC